MINVLVVDDEEWIRRGIVEKADWEQLNARVIAEAANGVEGLELARRHRPEIVITDMKMPVQDGPEFMAVLQREFPRTKVVVISGYSDYEYTRQALVNKAVDYILKPIEKEILNQVLAKAIQTYQAEMAEKRHADQNLCAAKDQLLNSLIGEGLLSGTEPRHLANILAGLAETGVVFQEGSFQVAVVWAVNFHRVCSQEYGGQTDRFDEAIYSQVAAFFGTDPVCFKRSGRANHLVVIYGAGSSAGSGFYPEELSRKYAALAAEFQNRLGLQVRIGIGRRYPKVEGLRPSFKEAVQAVNGLNILGPDQVRFYHETETPEKRVYPGNSENIDLLLKLICGGDPDAVARQLDGIMAQFQTAGYLTLDALQSFALEYLLKLQEELKAFPLDPAAVFEENLAGQTEKIIQFDTLDEFEAWLRPLALRITDSIRIHCKAGSKEVVRQIQDYLREHFGEKIKLNTIAAKFYLSESYLCKAFKKETGQNFVDYLTAIRMQKARSLLENYQLKIQEVASLVGYEDARHFSKVFKRYFRNNPSHIKENPPD